MTKYNREDTKTTLPQLERNYDDIIAQLKPHKTHVKITSSVGTVKLVSAYRVGRIMFLHVTASNTSSVSSGNKIADAVIKHSRPLQRANGVGYNGGYATNNVILTDGNLVCRNASGGSIPANTVIHITFVYIVGEK